MTGLEVVALVNAALAGASAAQRVAKQIMQTFDDMVKRGEITPEQQQQVSAEYQKYLRERQFTGPEWQVSNQQEKL